MLYDPKHLEACRPFATEVQQQYIDAIISAGGVKRAANLLNRHHSTLQESIAKLKVRAAAHGVAPDYNLNTPVPDPFIVKGHSTLDRVDPITGEHSTILQWTKTRIDDARWLEQVKEGINAFINDQPPIITLPEAPSVGVETDIIPWIQIGDAHLGMLAHAAETHKNFDLHIAETELTTAIAILIDQLPPVERLVINDLGDFTHYENMLAITEGYGHMLDADGRFPKMITVYSRLMRRIVEMALTKAQFVDVIVNQGNHSRTNDIWMAELLRVAYGHTGRVNVLNNHNVFIGYRMGRTFVMTHHSDKCRPNDLAGVMTTDFRRDWGEADYCYIDIGHIHHQMVSKEHPGVQIESFNILAPRDKYAHEGGWRSRQSITMLFRSRSYGEIGRRVLPIREVYDRIMSTNASAEHYVPEDVRAFTV